MKELIYRIRIWNVWFNPIFSPSLYAKEVADNAFKGFMEGVRKGLANE